ncbi:hypothetical protein AWB64_02115 [Caballeronia sordidicola]|uniref:Uncharacterized protein n=1 Tax=Caballeronia sordidicola TaxID=196367 RepID=A0A158G1P6_CABSO|nr:hypothetical protein AWB64_02115 [Caballeronia sordidicola]
MQRGGLIIELRLLLSADASRSNLGKCYDK